MIIYIKEYYKTNAIAKNDNNNLIEILNFSYDIKDINLLPRQAPANPKIAKMKIKKIYSFMEKLKK